MKKLNVKKIEVFLETLMFFMAIFSFVVFILKFLLNSSIISMTTHTMNLLLQDVIFSLGILAVDCILAVITRIYIINKESNNKEENKQIISRIIFADLLFIFVICLVFYYFNIYNSNYSIFEFIKILFLNHS